MTNPKPSVADGLKVEAHDESFGKNAENAVKKTPVVGKGYSTVSDAFTNFGKAENAGDFAAASGQLVTDGAGFVASCAGEVAGFALDPIGWLVSNGLNMLIELIQPLQDALHFVTGDGPSLGTASGNFETIGKGFVSLAEDFVKTGDAALKDWTEDAGKAAKDALGDFAVGIQGVGSSAGSVAQTLKMWSMVMTVIEEVVKAIISELVSWMIYIWLPALAASVASFGASVATAMTASIAKAGAAFGRISGKLAKLGKLLEKFLTFLARWADEMIKAGSKLTRTGRAAAESGTLARVGDDVVDVVTPGMQKAVGGAFGKATGSSGRLTLDAVGEVAKGIPNTLARAVTGVNPADAAKSGAHGMKATVDAAGKVVDHLDTGHDMSDKAGIGGGKSAEETSENLDM